MSDYRTLSVLYYDASKPIGTSLDGDLEFYEKHIENSKSVLEAGVGTGRLLIPYLKKGITIEGIDMSSEMIDFCTQQCENHQNHSNMNSYLMKIRK